MLDSTATTWLKRLLTWLEVFEPCFERAAQRGAFRRYIQGLLSDSRRKSKEAMWARLSDPGTYQAFQHFISHAPWDAERVWKHLRATVPDRTGVLILDGTSFPKQGKASVGVARQYLSSPAVTAECVYLPAREMLTVSHDFKVRSYNSAFTGNGLSSPAVGSDGSIYVVALDGAIWKYQGAK